MPSVYFEKIVNEIPQIGLEYFTNTLIEYAHLNLVDSNKTIKELPALKGMKAGSSVIISAGPSVHKKRSIKRILDAKYEGTTVAVDGSYIASLKAGLIPDFVVSLDPCPKRMVRWFGDHEFEEHSKGDDYFTRQDLDITFRENSLKQNQDNIELVNKFGHRTKAIVASSCPRNVIERLKEAKFDLYWWNPLVDDPNQPDSVTRKLYNINKLPCMNTGGNVGTAAWVFANSFLKTPRIGMVGMDYGYYIQTPHFQTQSYYELLDRLGSEEALKECFMEFEFPLNKEKFYTDPTYFWYRRNFLELMSKSDKQNFNCTEGGTLFSSDVTCITLDEFLQSTRRVHG